MGTPIGHLNVRRSIWIQASPAEVWHEFESFERIAGWLSKGHVLHAIELKVGGRADFSVELDGERRRYGGRVLVYERERELTLESNWAPPHAWPVPTLWTIRLTPLYDGTQVELYHHGFERLGAEAGDLLEGYEEGWDVKHLKALRAIVEH
jgi:uncharacterized protein YndB with AHSA1/START domain